MTRPTADLGEAIYILTDALQDAIEGRHPSHYSRSLLPIIRQRMALDARAAARTHIAAIRILRRAQEGTE